MFSSPLKDGPLNHTRHQEESGIRLTVTIGGWLGQLQSLGLPDRSSEHDHSIPQTETANTIYFFPQLP